MPEDMPDRMPNRMSEDMSDRMPEDLPVRKCINVMVGITRSKVFFSCDSLFKARTAQVYERVDEHCLQMCAEFQEKYHGGADVLPMSFFRKTEFLLPPLTRSSQSDSMTKRAQRAWFQRLLTYLQKKEGWSASALKSHCGQADMGEELRRWRVLAGELDSTLSAIGGVTSDEESFLISAFALGHNDRNLTEFCRLKLADCRSRKAREEMDRRVADAKQSLEAKQAAAAAAPKETSNSGSVGRSVLDFVALSDLSSFFFIHTTPCDKPM